MNHKQFALDLEMLHARVAAWGRSTDPLTTSEDLSQMGEELTVALEKLQVVEEELQRQNRAMELARLAAEAERRRYQDLFEFAPDGYLVTDLEATVGEANRAAARLLGVQERFLIGNPLALFVAAEDRRTFRAELMRRLADGDRVEELHLRLQPRDAAAFPAALTVAVVADRHGHPTGLRWLIRPVHRPHDGREPQPTDQGLQTQVAALTDADRRKDEFLAMLAHELRNPLAPLSLSLQVLRRGTADRPEAAHALDVAHHQVEKLARLVNELLDVARIRQGKTDLRMERVDLAAVAAAAVETVRPLLDERLHVLETALPPGPLPVMGDAGRLEQVLTNLLTNAAKYTEPGGRVSLRLERQGGEAVVRVRDTGVGLVAELLPRIFEPFVQSERSLRRARGGLGLGLSLVKRFVELHGGTVTAHSDGPGCGSEFVVRLSALPPSPPAPEAAMSEAATPGRSVSVLIVDDNRDAAESLAELVRLWGCRAATAYDGPAALAAARETPPDLVFLDIGLPGMDGYETAEKLREGLKPPPVLVALTGFGGDEERQCSRRAGFHCHLVKPVDPAAVKELIACGRRSSATSALTSRPAAPSTTG